MRVRTRLTPADRRASLISVGTEMFAAQSYDAVRMDEVAERAKCSRALLYHYFPTKRALYLAVVELTMIRLAQLTAPDETLEPLDRLRASLESYFAYAQEHTDHYRAMYRAAALDPELDAQLRSARRAQEDRIMSALPEEMRSKLVRLHVRASLSLVTAMCLDWLDEPDMADRAVMARTSVQMLNSAVAAALREEREKTNRSPG